MRELIIKWITLDAENYIPAVWIAVAVLWVTLVVFGLLSIRSQGISAAAKTTWALVIVLLPFAGMLAYCIFCLARVDYHMLDFWFVKRSKGGPDRGDGNRPARGAASTGA